MPEAVPSPEQVSAVFARMARLLRLDREMAADRAWLSRVLTGLRSSMDDDALRRALVRRGAHDDEVDGILAVLRTLPEPGAPAPATEAASHLVAAKPSSV